MPGFIRQTKASEDLQVGDFFRVAGQLYKIETVGLNASQEMILNLELLGTNLKSHKDHPRVMLIVPPHIPFEIHQ